MSLGLLRAAWRPEVTSACYLEDDYISVHKDHQVGDCIDVQFPVSLASPGGVRVLSRGFLRMRYDTSGNMNLLGPRVWHEVPPLLKMSPDSEPRRFNMGFRFLPDGTAVVPAPSTQAAIGGGVETSI